MSGRADSVLVIGAGPAGSTAAAMLAQEGIAVTLVEQSRFPRHKVCGECLSDLGMRALERAGLGGAVRGLRPVRLERACLVAAGVGPVEVDLPAPMWGVTRKSMDDALLRAARAAGARVLQPTRVERLTWCPTPSAVVRDLYSNEVHQLEADLILVADGRSALLGAKPGNTGELGVKAHFEGVDSSPRTISLFGLDGHYVGLAPVSDGQRDIWNLAVAVPAARVRAFGGDHEALLGEMRRENLRLDIALRGARRIGHWSACPLPRFAVRGQWPSGVIPLGNAAAALEPIGGEGMGLAIASAALAGQFVLEGRCNRADLVELRGRYVRLWRRRQRAWRALAVILSRPRLARLAARAANVAPRLAASLATRAKAPAGGTGAVSRRRASVLS